MIIHFIYFFFHLFLFIGGQLLYNIVVASAIHRHESAMDLHVFPIPIPPPASLPIPSLWALPVHQPWAPISCIQPGLVICFTLDSILVSMLFSPNIPPSPSPTESKTLFCICVSFSVLHIPYHLLKFHIYALVYCSEKCKSKPQRGTITHQSEWLLSKSLQAINAGEGVEKREPSYTVGGNAN